MATMNLPSQAKPSPVPTHSDVQIPRREFGRIFDLLMSAQRLTLAQHRIEEEKRDGGFATAGELIAWETFISLRESCDQLGHHAVYGPGESEPE